jgi:hypothetical protein
MSMTNYSLIPQEMLACGLPCVELRHPSIVLPPDLQPGAGRDGLQGGERAAPRSG